MPVPARRRTARPAASDRGGRACNDRQRRTAAGAHGAAGAAPWARALMTLIRNIQGAQQEAHLTNSINKF